MNIVTSLGARNGGLTVPTLMAVLPSRAKASANTRGCIEVAQSGPYDEDFRLPDCLQSDAVAQTYRGQPLVVPSAKGEIIEIDPDYVIQRMRDHDPKMVSSLRHHYNRNPEKTMTHMTVQIARRLEANKNVDVERPENPDLSARQLNRLRKIKHRQNFQKNCTPCTGVCTVTLGTLCCLSKILWIFGAHKEFEATV